MSNNIFENAFFGKKYITRGGEDAIYIGKTSDNYHMLCFKNASYGKYYDDGRYFKDNPSYEIISEWTIDDKKLNELAENYCETKYFDDEFEYIRVKNSFKAGYRTALGVICVDGNK